MSRQPCHEDPLVEAARERQRAAAREKYRRNALRPEWKEKRNAVQRAFHMRHREKILAKAAANGRLHKERLKLRRKAYVSTHPEIIQAVTDRQLKKRRAFLNDFRSKLNDGHCNHPGCTMHWQLCDIDHLRPELKKHNLGDTRLRWRVVEGEIKRNTTPDGVVHLQLLCPVHHRIKSGLGVGFVGLKQRAVRAWKLQQFACGVCGVSVENLPMFCFDADHLDRSTKTDAVAAMVKKKQYDVATVKAELIKCRMLCANCHRIHTHIQRNTSVAEWIKSVWGPSSC